MTSSDGITWTPHLLPAGGPCPSIVYGNSTFLLGYSTLFQSAPVQAPFEVSAVTESTVAAVPGFDQGSIRIQRSSSATIGIDLRVNFSLSGSAQSGSDYLPLSNSVVIPAGLASVTIPVVAQGTLDAASTKTLVLTLEPGEAYSFGSSRTAPVLIENPGHAPRFRRTGTSRTPDGTVHLMIDSPVGAVLAIESTENLQNWLPLTTVTNSTGVNNVADSAEPASNRRLYRAKRLAH